MSSPSRPALSSSHAEAIFKLKHHLAKRRGGGSCPPASRVSASSHLCCLFKPPASKTTITLSDLRPPAARDQSGSAPGRPSLMVTADTLWPLGCNIILLLQQITLPGLLQVFWMQEFSASHPSPFCSSLYPPRQLSNGLSRGPAVIEKRDCWLVAAAEATICESEWSGECCVGGAGEVEGYVRARQPPAGSC